MPEFLSEIEELKVLYKEIIDGYSFDAEKNLFIKHFSDLENSELSRIRSNVFSKLIKEGLPSEAQKLKLLIDSEQWSEVKEDEILSFEFQISDNEKNLQNILGRVIPEQQDIVKKPILRAIDEAKKSLRNLRLERHILMGLTANSVAEKEGLHFLISRSIFKDKNLKEPFFPDNLDELEFEELELYMDLLDANLKRFLEENIRKISVLGFFLNPFSYSKDNIHNFIHRAICEMTTFQLTLFSLGNRNLTTLSQTSGEPPELVGDIKLNDLLKWYDTNYSILQTKRKSGN